MIRLKCKECGGKLRVERELKDGIEVYCEDCGARYYYRHG